MHISTTNLLPGQPRSRQRPHSAGKEAGHVSRPQVPAGDKEPFRWRRGHLPPGFHQVLAHLLVSRQGQAQAEEGHPQAGERGGRMERGGRRERGGGEEGRG